MHGGRGVAVETAEELIGGSATNRLRVLRNDRDRGVEQVGQRDVVEADQRNVAFAIRGALAAMCGRFCTLMATSQFGTAS